VPVPPGLVWHLRSCLGWPDAPVKTLAGSLSGVRQPGVLRLTVVQNSARCGLAACVGG